jgi:hypothetical protein
MHVMHALDLIGSERGMTDLNRSESVGSLDDLCGLQPWCPGMFRHMFYPVSRVGDDGTAKIRDLVSATKRYGHFASADHFPISHVIHGCAHDSPNPDRDINPVSLLPTSPLSLFRELMVFAGGLWARRFSWVPLLL